MTSAARVAGLTLAGVAVFAFVALSSVGNVGCATSCDTTGDETIEYTGGELVGSVYMSSPWNGSWLHFPSERRYRLAHKLGTSQVIPQFWVSFWEHPFTSENDTNASQASGNQVVIEDITADYVQVRNDTCTEFYLMAWISAPAADAQPSER